MIRLNEDQTKTVEYNKLVRDNMPEIIKFDGNEAKYRFLRKEEMFCALKLKLEEECAEFIEDSTLDELADIIECVLALAVNLGASAIELESRRVDKARARGSFDNGVWLESVTYNHVVEDPYSTRKYGEVVPIRGIE